MGKVHTVQQLWDSHWEQEQTPALAVLKSRYTREAFAAIRQFIDERDVLILEAGCGTGRFCGLLAKENPDADVVGIDISSNAIKHARDLQTALGCPNVAFHEASIFSIPYPDNHFDLVFNEGVIPYFSDDSSPTHEDALREMIRVTKPGGKVLVGVPNWYCLPHTLYKWWNSKGGRQFEYGDERSYTRAQLARLFRKHGLRSVQTSGYYPSYGFYRLSFRLNARFSRSFQLMASLVDRLDGPSLSKVAGFYILACALK